MAAPTDLTFQELQDAFIKIGIDSVFLVDSYGNISGIDLSGILGNQATGTRFTGGGVVKFAVKFLEAYRIAPEVLNESQIPGERLIAFPTASMGSVSSGFVPVTRSSIQSRYELASAIRIVGNTG